MYIEISVIYLSVFFKHVGTRVKQTKAFVLASQASLQILYEQLPQGGISEPGQAS